MRARRRLPFAALAAAGLVAGALAGCGSCVKDDPQQQSASPSLRKKPLPLVAADKRLSPFERPGAGAEGGAPAAVSDASSD